MRLIDADALIQLLCVNMDTGNQFNRATHCVDVMPTVDAIPIGWIEEQIRESYDASTEYDGSYDYAWAFSELVKRWRVENGTVD